MYRILAYLEQRVFKWDEVKKGSGVKDSRNWILCKTFSCVMERKAARQGHTHQPPESKKPNCSVNWSGTCKFPEMVQLCQEHGDSILIGFTGGRTAFANTTLEKSQNRHHSK